MGPVKDHPSKVWFQFGLSDIYHSLIWIKFVFRLFLHRSDEWMKDDNGCKVMVIAHFSLWVRWTKNCTICHNSSLENIFSFFFNKFLKQEFSLLCRKLPQKTRKDHMYFSDLHISAFHEQRNFLAKSLCNMAGDGNSSL